MFHCWQLSRKFVNVNLWHHHTIFCILQVCYQKRKLKIKIRAYMYTRDLCHFSTRFFIRIIYLLLFYNLFILFPYWKLLLPFENYYTFFYKNWEIWLQSFNVFIFREPFYSFKEKFLMCSSSIIYFCFFNGKTFLHSTMIFEYNQERGFWDWNPPLFPVNTGFLYTKRLLFVFYSNFVFHLSRLA